MFLSCFNWFLEILKWQFLVGYVKKISFTEALSQSLGALTASLFTPNRIGEYGAKVIYYTPKYRKRILLLNFIGNAMQMSITILFGSLGLFFLVKHYPIEINFVRGVRGLLVIITLAFFSIFGLRQNKYKIKGFAIDRIKQFIKELPIKTKGVTWLLSLLRYLVFSFQFYFLLFLFGINLNYLEAMMLITSTYLISSLIPTVFLFDVIIKGSVAVYLFSFTNSNEFTILCIITLMWLFNFVLPSVFGSIYVLNFNWPEKDN